MRQIERSFQTLLFLSRWLITPFLVGLVACLLLLIYRFFADFYALAIRLPTLSWHELIVDMLNLVDLSLAANLILIVVFSGFENFLHTVDHGERSELPRGLVEIGFGALKQRLIGSIAVIAAVDALAWYLDLEKVTDTARLGWAIAFPLMFVVSLVLLALSDWLVHRNDKAD